MIWAIPFLLFSLFAVPSIIHQLMKIVRIYRKSRDKTYTIEVPTIEIIFAFLFILLVGIIWYAVLTGAL